MTDAEKYVRQFWPEAYVWGRMKNGRRDYSGKIVIGRSPLDSFFSSSGETETEAWANAANKLRATDRTQEPCGQNYREFQPNETELP